MTSPFGCYDPGRDQMGDSPFMFDNKTGQSQYNGKSSKKRQQIGKTRRGKTTLWQQCLTDNICVCLIKKHLFNGKTRKKMKSHSETDCRGSDIPNDKNPPQKPYKCKPKSYDCPRRGCIPTERSLCGCHFYFNLENLPSEQYSDKNNLKTYCKTNDEPTVIPKCKEVTDLPGMGKYTQEVKGNGPSIENTNSTNSNIHFGITFVKEETKYLIKDGVDCLTSKCVDESTNGKNNKEGKDIVTLSSEEFMVEVHNNDEELKQVKHQDKGRVRFHEDLDQPAASLGHSSARPQSESLHREILPFMKNRNLSSLLESEVISQHYISPNLYSEMENDNKNHSETFKDYAKERDTQVDLNEQTSYAHLATSSTTSLARLGNHKIKRNSINSQNTTSRNAANDDTIIYITRSRSRSCSPARTEETSEFYRSCDSQYAGSSVGRRESKQKIVIKLSRSKNNNNYSQSLPKSKTPSKKNTINEEKISWKEISDELKLTNPPAKCYCYECMCKRINGSQ